MHHAIIFPTRTRNKEAAAAFASAIATASGPLVFYVRLDNDDAGRFNLQKDLTALIKGTPHKLYIKHGARMLFGSVPSYNELAYMAHERGADIIQQMSDDQKYVTPGWDLAIQKYVMNLLPEKKAAVFFVKDTYECDVAQDNLLDITYMAHSIVTRQWYEHFSYFFAPVYTHFCADWEISFIAKKANRLVYVPGPIIEHNKGQAKDKLFGEIRGAEWKERDYLLYTRRFTEMTMHINSLQHRGVLFNREFIESIKDNYTGIKPPYEE